MKALTDTIIELIERQAEGQFNEFAKKQLLLVVEQIKEAERDAEFEEIARVMMKHLGNGEKYHPHITVIITNTHAEALEGIDVIDEVYEYIPD